MYALELARSSLVTAYFHSCFVTEAVVYSSAMESVVCLVEEGSKALVAAWGIEKALN